MRASPLLLAEKHANRCFSPVTWGWAVPGFVAVLLLLVAGHAGWVSYLEIKVEGRGFALQKVGVALWAGLENSV